LSDLPAFPALKHFTLEVDLDEDEVDGQEGEKKARLRRWCEGRGIELDLLRCM
jgi:hypothetical protein